MPRVLSCPKATGLARDVMLVLVVRSDTSDSYLKEGRNDFHHYSTLDGGMESMAVSSSQISDWRLRLSLGARPV